MTGGIACGKSLAAHYFKELDVPVIDADAIALTLTTANPKILAQIYQHFGAVVFDAQGGLLRRKLREIIFSNETQRLWLENLLHPLILQQMQEATRHLNTRYCIWMIPLLLEKNITVDRVLVIDCPTDMQIARLKQRDNLDEKQILAALKLQLSRESRLANADDVIENIGSKEDFQHEIQQLHEKYNATI